MQTSHDYRPMCFDPNGNFRLLLELRGELPHQALVHVTTSDPIRGLAKHVQLATHELDNAHGEN